MIFSASEQRSELTDDRRRRSSIHSLFIFPYSYDSTSRMVNLAAFRAGIILAR